MSRGAKSKAAKAAASRRSATAARQTPRSPVVVPARKLDLSKIRHDLRTPINHILGYCEMLQEDEQLPAVFAPDRAAGASPGFRYTFRVLRIGATRGGVAQSVRAAVS